MGNDPDGISYGIEVCAAPNGATYIDLTTVGTDFLTRLQGDTATGDALPARSRRNAQPQQLPHAPLALLVGAAIRPAKGCGVVWASHDARTARFSFEDRRKESRDLPLSKEPRVLCEGQKCRCLSCPRGLNRGYHGSPPRRVCYAASDRPLSANRRNTTFQLKKLRSGSGLDPRRALPGARAHAPPHHTSRRRRLARAPRPSRQAAACA